MTAQPNKKTGQTTGYPSIADATQKSGRVAALALAGLSPREIAAQAGLAKSTVDWHLRKLVAGGALRIVRRGERGRAVYARGANTSTKETRPVIRGEGAGGASEPEVPVRVHRGGWAWPVRWVGNLTDAPWVKSWDPNRTGKGDTDFRLHLEGWGLWLKIAGPGGVSMLMTEPPGEFVFTQDEVWSARARRQAAARDVAARFAQEHGAQLYLARGYEYQPTEYAVNVPGAQRFGEPGSSLVWVDGSPEDGTTEIETQDPKIAQSFLEVPRLTKDVRELKQVAGALVEFAAFQANLELARFHRAQKLKPLEPRDDPGVA